MIKRKKAKREKVERVFGTKEVNLVSDLMISFIGFCIIILAFISLTGRVPREYTFGATLAGFWFVYSDIMIIDETLKLRDLIAYMFFIFMGIFSFIVMPVIIQILPSFGEQLMLNSDFFTFMALGAVLAAMGVKTIFRKRDQTTTRIEKLENELETLQSKSDELKASLTEAENRLIESENKLREMRQ